MSSGEILIFCGRPGLRADRREGVDAIAFLRYRRSMPWVVETLSPTVDAEIGALPADMRARFVRFVELIEQIGFEALPRDSVKHLEDRLWELRMTGRDGISRAI